MMVDMPRRKKARKTADEPITVERLRALAEQHRTKKTAGPLTVEECRAILKRDSPNMTDEQVLKLRDDITQVANALADEIQRKDYNEIGWELVMSTATEEDLKQWQEEDERIAAWEEREAAENAKPHKRKETVQ